jgi:2-polyprenyl-3-methyl-5-hydroxy-6-metoxy-1,4-benzoquinol methylase
MIAEEQIRPDFLLNINKNLYLEDIKELLKNKNEFVYVVCPACQSKQYIPKFNKNGFNFVECANCKTVYINPRPTLNMLEKYYSEGKSIQYWNDEIYPKSEEIRRSKIFKPRAMKIIKLCLKYGVPTSSLADIGSGYGTFCEEVMHKNIFKEIIAIEPSHKLAQTCRKKGIKIIENIIEHVNLKNINIITCFELLEHIFQPNLLINSCYKKLSTNGLLILTMPNSKGFDLAELGKYSDNYAGPNHLNYFNINSIQLLLKKNGFEILEIYTPGELDAEIVHKKIISGGFKSKSPFINYILTDLWDDCGIKFQKFLSNNQLSSHLWVVARKKCD